MRRSLDRVKSPRGAALSSRLIAFPSYLRPKGTSSRDLRVEAAGAADHALRIHCSSIRRPDRKVVLSIPRVY